MKVNSGIYKYIYEMRPRRPIYIWLVIELLMRDVVSLAAWRRIVLVNHFRSLQPINAREKHYPLVWYILG